MSMRSKKSNNIFDSFKFCYHVNKLSGYLFFSIRKDEPGKFYSSTLCDVMFFIASFIFTFYPFILVWRLPLILSSRSVILGIGTYLNLKTTILHPLILISMNFFNRHDMFEVLQNLNWMDEKVRNYFHSVP